MGQTVPIDTADLPVVDSLLVQNDSIVPARATYKVSNDALDAPVEYVADDSMIYDIKHKKIYLYGNASVKYSTIELKADYILLDWSSNIVTAEGQKDSLGNLAGNPVFSDGGESFTAKHIKYNFQTRKGIISDATSIQNDVYVLSSKGKFVAHDPQDSTHTDDVIYSKDAIFTSCNLEHPHYGIRSNKQKIIPNKTVVVGPSNIEIGGVPTPLWLPFGFFPIASTAQAGVIIPRDYEFDPRYGFGISNIGYFTPIGEHFNLQLTADYYVKNRWGFHARSQYKKRYKYDGTFSFDFGSVPEEQSDASIIKSNSYNIVWRHNQARTAHPTRFFGGNINLSIGDYQRIFRNDARSVLNNELNSRLNFTYTPLDQPWNLTASFDHNQNNRTELITINFPNLDFNMRRVYPFKRKNAIGAERWFEKIGFTYKANAKNRYQSTDSTFLKGSALQILDEMDYGAQHRLDGNTTFNLLKYFRVTPNFNISHTLLPKLRKINFDPRTQIIPRDTTFQIDDPAAFTINYDTLYGEQTIDTLDTWANALQMSGGVSTSFDVFSTILFKKGKLRGIRHFGKPTISLNYSPNYNQKRFIDSVRFDNRFDIDSLEGYSRFVPGGLYGTPNISGEQFAVGYGMSNVFQAKFLDRDSSMQYKNLLEELSFNGNYNFAADSLEWSPISARLRGNWFRNFLNIAITARFDPYERTAAGRRVNQLTWNRSKNRRLFDFVNATLPITNRFTVRQIRGWVKGKEKEEEDPIEAKKQREKERKEKSLGSIGEIEDFWSLFDGFSLSHNVTFEYSRIGEIGEKRDTFRIRANSIRLRGDLQITPHWSVGVDNLSYDFVNKSFVYPSFRFYRDLHCWETGLSWQPARGTYSFFLRVKPGTLGFIEVPYQQRNLNAFNGF